MVGRVVPAGQQLTAALEIAGRLADLPRAALSRAKLALDQGPALGIDAAYEIEISNALALHGGPDAQAAAMEFQARGVKKEES